MLERQNPDIFEAMVRDAILGLWGDLPTTPEASFGDFLLFNYQGWSAALCRVDTIAVASDLPTLLEITGNSHAVLTKEIAASVAEAALGSIIATLRKRHCAAIALGLFKNGQYRDLKPARLLVDRALINILDDMGLDLRGCAREMWGPATRAGPHDYFECIIARFNADDATIEDSGDGRPKISTSVKLGDWTYDGGCLSIPKSLPQVVCAAATGLNLGTIVATGRPELDRRIIS